MIDLYTVIILMLQKYCTPANGLLKIIDIIMIDHREGCIGGGISRFGPTACQGIDI